MKTFFGWSGEGDGPISMVIKVANEEMRASNTTALSPRKFFAVTREFTVSRRFVHSDGAHRVGIMTNAKS